MAQPNMSLPSTQTNSKKTAVYAALFLHLDLEKGFVSLKVLNGSKWEWVHYPIKNNHWMKNRLSENDWKTLSPTLVIKDKYVGLHFPQEKTVIAKK